jgi:hypothetical protein
MAWDWLALKVYVWTWLGWIVPWTCAAVAPAEKMIFVTDEVVVAAGVEDIVGEAVRVGGSGVGVSCGGAGVKEGCRVAVGAISVGRLQLINTISNAGSNITRVGFLKGRYGRLDFMLNHLLNCR